jgi:hypothetical protein
VFLTVSGQQLLLGGQPYRMLGMNLWAAADTSWSWVANDGSFYGANDSTLQNIITVLKTGAPHANTLRVWFFQSMAIDTTNGNARRWDAFDHVLTVCAANGIKVIATLADEWWNNRISNAGTTWNTHNLQVAWWQGGYTTQVLDRDVIPYRQWVQECVTHYANDDRICIWEMVNEGKDRNYANDLDGAGTPSGTQGADVRAFVDDIGALIKSISPSHLVAFGSDASTWGGATYNTIEQSVYTDLVSYHDYTGAANTTGDQGGYPNGNGLPDHVHAISQWAKPKPIYIGEVGIANSVGLSQRATYLQNKMTAQFAMQGVVGYLPWNLGPDDGTYNYQSGDPSFAVLESFYVAPSAPVGTRVLPNRDITTTGWHDESRATSGLYAKLADSSSATYATSDVLDRRTHLPRGIRGVILIITDDEDAWESLPAYRRNSFYNRIWAKATRFPNFVATHSLCAPFRAAFLSGQYDINNGVTGNNVWASGEVRPSTGKPPETAMDFMSPYATIWNTIYGLGQERRRAQVGHVGKFINHWESALVNQPGPFIPTGLDFFSGLSVSPDSSQGCQFTEVAKDDAGNIISNTLYPPVGGTLWNSQNQGPTDAPFNIWDQQTDIIAIRALEFLDDCLNRPTSDARYGLPFFLTLCPGNPHAVTGDPDCKVTTDVPSPTNRLERIKHLHYQAMNGLTGSGAGQVVGQIAGVNQVTREARKNFFNVDVHSNGADKLYWMNPQFDRRSYQANGTLVHDPTFSVVTGTSTAVTATTLTDNTKAWTVNQWKNCYVQLPGLIHGFIVSNTATTLTILEWTSMNRETRAATPSAGGNYTIRPGAPFLNVDYDDDTLYGDPTATAALTGLGGEYGYRPGAGPIRAYDRMRQLIWLDDLIETLCCFLENPRSINPTSAEATNILDDVLIIYTADNGVYYGVGQNWDWNGKDNCYETDLKVPFFIRGPGFQEGVTNNANITNVNLYATLCDLFGFSVAQGTKSQDAPTMLPAVADETAQATHPVYISGSNRVFEGIRYKGWKYIENASPQYLTSEIQKTNVTGGTFKVRYNGSAWSADIAYNASAATVQSALQGLSTVGAGNMIVTAISVGWRIEYQGAFAYKRYLPKIEVDATGLTGTNLKLCVKVATYSGSNNCGNATPAFELYDMDNDPYEMVNLYGVNGTSARDNMTYAAIGTAMESYRATMRACAGANCTITGW